MNTRQRKKHKIIWLLLLVIVPILLVFTIVNLKEPLFTQNNALGVVKAEAKQIMLENETFTVLLDPKNTDGNLQIFLKKSLESPAPLVYAVSKDMPKDSYIGTLTAKGKYDFKINSTTTSVKIYDAIKKEELLNIPLSWD